MGVVSYSLGDQCDPKDLMVFARVSLFRDFIVEKSKGVVNFLDNFKCKNGSKIAFLQKCDGIFDCLDGDDESDCGKSII